MPRFTQLERVRTGNFNPYILTPSPTYFQTQWGGWVQKSFSRKRWDRMVTRAKDRPQGDCLKMGKCSTSRSGGERLRGREQKSKISFVL